MRETYFFLFLSVRLRTIRQRHTRKTGCVACIASARTEEDDVVRCAQRTRRNLIASFMHTARKHNEVERTRANGTAEPRVRA